MYSTILLAVDGSDYSEWSRKLAVSMLAPGGRINLIHVIDIVALEGTFLQDLSGAIGVEPYMSLSPKLEKILRDKGQATLDYHKGFLDKEGIACKAEMASGIIANEIAKKANECEVVVIGQRGANARFHAGLAGSVSEVMLRRSPRPVVIVPGEPTTPIQKVLLGFDGSAPSSRSMTEADRICRANNLSLTVLTIDDVASDAESILAEARDFFSHAKYPIEFSARAGSVNEVLLREAAHHDLMVVGAHGHRRIVEFVIGSTTAYLLRNITVPTLFHR